jgi:thiamine-monophosphate kinase
MSAEFYLIDRIRARVIRRGDVRLGIGDDAALLVPHPTERLVAACDTMNVGVHFPPDTAPADIGWKALAVNLSDLAAMGATPAWALLSLSLPSPDGDWLDAFLDGFTELAALHDVALVGGDTTRGPLSICVTALGFVPHAQALKRASAHPGDIVCVTGTLGDAAAGLRLWNHSGTDGAHAALRTRLTRPTPRVAAAAILRGRARACIDVSDGLLADLGHVARASAVAIEIDAIALPASEALQQTFDTTTRLPLMASGGDDYELAFTVPEIDCDALLADLMAAGTPATRIGRVRDGDGVTLLDADGNALPTPPGWLHFGEPQH